MFKLPATPSQEVLLHMKVCERSVCVLHHLRMSRKAAYTPMRWGLSSCMEGFTDSIEAPYFICTHQQIPTTTTTKNYNGTPVHATHTDAHTSSPFDINITSYFLLCKKIVAQFVHFPWLPPNTHTIVAATPHIQTCEHANAHRTHAQAPRTHAHTNTHTYCDNCATTWKRIGIGVSINSHYY